MTVSIKDIAKHCQLNPSTVSRALNNKYGVKPETRKRVVEAATQLGYVPSLPARELVNKQGNLIGIVIPESDAEAQPAFFAMLPSINKKLSVYGLDTIIYAFSPVQYRAGDLDLLIRKRNLRGCIIMPGFIKRHKLYEDVKNSTIPTVVIEVTVDREGCSSIHTDEVYGAYEATKHLIHNGHRKIGFVNGPGSIQICQERRKGYENALKDAGIEVFEKHIVHCDFSGEAGGQTAFALLEKWPELTALFFASDIMAMGAISLLVEKGYNIPQDLSIVGYDGIFLSKYYNPPLTTIKSDDVHLGLRTAELLIQILEHQATAKEWIRPELMIGKSVTKLQT